MKNTLMFLVLAFAACGNSGVCNPKVPAQQTPCPAGVVSSTGAACTDDNGSSFICRNGSGYCMVCKGPKFTEGCALSGQTTAYCVEDCSDC